MVDNKLCKGDLSLTAENSSKQLEIFDCYQAKFLPLFENVKAIR